MRIRVIKIIFIVLCLILLLDIFWMQVINGPEYLERAENNRIRLVPEEASRGIIYDRNNIPLVENKLVFDIVVIPLEIKDKPSFFEVLSGYLDMNASALEDNFNNNLSYSFFPVLVAQDVPRMNAFIVEQDRTRLPGVFVKPRAVRNYIYNKAAAHLLGYVGKMREEDYPEFKKYGYEAQDVIGCDGIERSFDSLLRGEAGGMQIQVDSRGRINKVLSYKPPVNGNNLYLTIDIKLQKLIYEALENLKGAVCVMDANTGEILAMCSFPSYDPNVFMAKNNSAEISAIFENKDAPFLNRNLLAYPPGSIFKIVTAYAALIEHKIDTKTVFNCEGKFKFGNTTFNCWLERGHGAIDLENAIATSCNVFFWNTGLKVGDALLAKYAAEFGIKKITGVELCLEQSGVIPDAQWKNQKLKQKWFGGDTLNYSIGQGYLLETPLEALRMVAYVANGGMEVIPHLQKKILPPCGKKNLDPAVLNIIKQGMYKVVNTDFGTGRRAFVENTQTYAKTGTAQIGNALPHAWFAGFTQVKDKTTCFVVFLEHGGHGGETAAEIGSRIIRYLNRH